MRIRPIHSARVEPIPSTHIRCTETPTASAVRDSARTSKMHRHAVEYHTDRLQQRLRTQQRTAAWLGVLSVVSIAVCVGLTLTAGPVVLAVVWTIPSGIFGGFVGIYSEIAQTRAEMQAAGTMS